MLLVNLPLVHTIHPQSNKFITGLKNKATVESKSETKLESRQALKENLKQSYERFLAWSFVESLS